MMSEIPDEAFVRQLQQLGGATPEQIEAAQKLKSEASAQGKPISLADALQQQGVITQSIRENIEKRALAATQGTKQVGQYRLIKKLGEGGMGIVFLAEDVNVGRKVALKILPKKFATPDFLARFRREAKSTGKLNHVNIVTAYDAGEDNGRHYYAMEFCDGEPLDVLLKREKTLPWDKAVEIVMQVARGLKHAHESGIIHRDIKPANIFIGKDGIAKILDMGLSKDLGDAEQSFNTQSGVALGTPHYISPEQARGEKKIDGRCDIYSLGAMFYHLVTGRTPYEGTTAAVIMLKHLSEQLPNPQDINPDIPDGIVHIIQLMMAKSPAHRYSDCAELLTDLELTLDGKAPSSAGIDAEMSSIAPAQKTAVMPPPANPRRPLAQQKKTTKPVAVKATVALPAVNSGAPAKNKTLLYAGGAAALLTIALIGYYATRGNKPDEQKNLASTPPSEVKTVATKPPETAKSDVKPPEPISPPTQNKDTSFGRADEAWIKSVAARNPEEQLDLVLAKLKELNPGYDGKLKHPPKDLGGNEVRELAFPTNSKISDLSPLRALTGLRDLICDGNSELKDLRPLRGLKLGQIHIDRTGVTDLSPVSDMPLYLVSMVGSPIEDLSPLRGKKLNALYLHTGVQYPSFEPLIGMPLETLYFSKPQDDDYSPLKNLPLKKIVADKTIIVKNRDIFQAIKTLEEINRIPVAEFWAQNGGVEASTPPVAAIEDPKLKSAQKTDLAKELILDLGKGVKMELVLIPAGTFMMGSPESEKERSADEKQHTVTISKAFYMAKYPATQEQYEAVMTENPSEFNKEKGGGPKNPVEKVSWDDAIKFCGKLYATVKAKLPNGMKLQLPTEAQWEYACRAGTKTRFYTGDEEDDLARAGWYAKNSDSKTHPVGQKIPNAFGLYDMHGNVWQWCQDWYGDYDARTVTDPNGTATGTKRVLRGASWYYPPVRCRSSSRGDYTPWYRYNTIGFRIVVAAPPTPAPAAPNVASTEPKELALDLGKGVKMDLVLIPAGTFQMGSPESEDKHLPNEKQHAVTISKAFYMGKFTVTQEQYEALTGKTPSLFKGAKNPVEQVSWDDAQEFCKALQNKNRANLQPGMEVQLPTEAQWEYACRAGTTTRFYSGDADSLLYRVAWRERNSDSTTHPVGQKEPNAFGLYDMHGNVFQWCQDWYGQDYYNNSPTIDPKGPETGKMRVCRGGSYSLQLQWFRSAFRYHLHETDNSKRLIGFRVVVSTPLSQPPETPPVKEAEKRSNAGETNVDDPARWKNAINLLPLADANADAVGSKWTINNGIRSSEKGEVRFELPYRPPEEFDFRVTFSREDGNHSVNQFFPLSSTPCDWRMGGWENTWAGFSNVEGKLSNANPTSVKLSLKNGTKYTSTVQVRKDVVRAYVDGVLVSQLDRRMNVSAATQVQKPRDPLLLGIGHWNSPTVFYSVEVLEITGKGTFTRPNDPAAFFAAHLQNASASFHVMTQAG